MVLLDSFFSVFEDMESVEGRIILKHFPFSLFYLCVDLVKYNAFA